MDSQEEKEEIIDISFRIGFTFVDVCGIILHLLLLFAFVKDPLKCFKNLRMSFIINLAISDFLVCLLSLLKVLTRTDANLSSFLNFLQRSVAIVSFATIASISVNRFLLIVYPIKHRYWIKGRTIAIWLTFIWLLNISYASKRLIFGIEQSYEGQLYMGTVLTLFVLTGTAYASVYVHFKKQSRNITQQNDSNGDRAEELRLLKEKRFLNTIIFIALMTVVTFIPGWILFYTLKYRSYVWAWDNLACRIILNISALFMRINFAINPIVYIFRFPNYRKTFQILYCRK